MPVTSVINTPGNVPYSVVVIDGIRLPAYVVGGVNVSIGELAFVAHAGAYFNQASGFSNVSGVPFGLHVTSGSGNIVTLTATNLGSGGAQLTAVTVLSAYPAAVVAYGR